MISGYLIHSMILTSPWTILYCHHSTRKASACFHPWLQTRRRGESTGSDRCPREGTSHCQDGTATSWYSNRLSCNL